MTPATSIYEYVRQGLAVPVNKTAIWFCGKRMTYRQLFQRIDNVANNMIALGVKPGTVVTIHLPNCPQAVVAIYAVAKLGGICNMVHPLVPVEGLRKNMNFTESKILITGNHFSGCGEVDFAQTIIYTDISAHMGFFYKSAYRMTKGKSSFRDGILFDALEKESRKPVQIPNQEEFSNCCAVYLHSSGTTGLPKAVMHSHQSLNCWVESAKVYYKEEDTSKQIVLSVIPPFHGIGFAMNLHRVLACGGTVVLMARWNAKEAVRLIKKHKITILVGVPTMYRSLLNCESFSGSKISQIKECFVGGDRTDASLKIDIDKRIGNGTHLYEAYGLTETVTACASISKTHYKEDASGYPLDQCYLAVLNDGEFYTVGSGELLVSSDTMMMGYLKMEEDTQEIFLSTMGRKWLRTGDYGEIDKDGYVYFRERIKHTIIHNGYNIYPNEVETIIRRLPEVKEVAVVGVYNQHKKTQDIRVCVVLKADQETCLPEVRENIIKACGVWLPRYALPNEIRFLTDLPQTHVGKVDYKALENLL